MIRIIFRILGIGFALFVLTLFALFGIYYEPQPGGDAPRVLVAIDRSLWNGLGLNRLTYVRALRRAGLDTTLVKYPEFGDIPPGVLKGFDGVVLTGGGDVAAAEYGGDPSVTRGVDVDRDDFELELLAQAEALDLPVLGLCRGAQLMNVERGGTLADIRDTPAYAVHRNLFAGHGVTLEAGSQLAGIFGRTRLDDVTTWHGQHVETPGEGIVITAYSEDGIAEAIEITDAAFMLGVQWHAEMPPWDASQQPLFDAFAAAARAQR